ncbi:hypothetical protein BH10PSE3_BH10PSE3_10200 [soil metagenome]
MAATRAVTGDIAKLRQAAQRLRRGDAPDFAASQFEEFAAVSDLLADAISQRDASRERFELAQDVGGIGSWEWDLVADEARVSDSYKQMHGLAHVEGALSFSQVVAAVHPEDRDGYLQTLADAKTRRQPSVSAYRVIHPDRSICWIEAKGRPLFDEAGRAVGAAGIVRDATAAHEAADALQRLNDLLAAQVQERTVERDRLWDIARDPFVIADADGVWLAASPAWTALLGYPVEDLVGRTSEWMEHPQDIARTRAEGHRVAGGHISERFENRFRAKDGTYRWLSWTSVPEGGRFYSVARDVTAEKEQAEALKRVEAALRQAQKMESIGQITGGVAHDFNNLLTPIVGTLDLLQQRGLTDPRSERMVVNAIEAAERARMLVQRLLAFARRQPLQTQAVDVAACLGGIGPLLTSTLGPLVQLEWRLDDPLPSVTADANQLEMAILNLAVNARDAMPDGGVLTLGATVRDFTQQVPEELAPGRYVELSVADTGVGMPQAVIDRAIEPFFSTKGLGRGTGLGLSMVHGLMAQLGGGMAIASAPGRGAQIRLWLQVADRPAEQRAAVILAPTAQFTGRVLLVDDEEIVRSTSAQMLADFGYTVIQAASAAEALTALEVTYFDLVVTDHLMPGMSGAELARTVRDRWPAVLVLIVSGYADVDDIAPDFMRLAKPFRRNELSDALGKLSGTAMTP